MLYVAVDIGCLECGESSSVLGVFSKEETAKTVCGIAKEIQAHDWHGEHSFEVFEVDEIDGIVHIQGEVK